MIFRTVPTATIQGGGNSKSPDLEKLEEDLEEEDLISDEEEDCIRITPIKSKKRTVNLDSETKTDDSEKTEPPKKKKRGSVFLSWNDLIKK